MFDEIYKKYSAEDIDNYECYSLFYKLLSELKKNFESRENKKIIPAVVRAKQLIESSFRTADIHRQNIKSCIYKNIECDTICNSASDRI